LQIFGVVNAAAWNLDGCDDIPVWYFSERLQILWGLWILGWGSQNL